LHKIDGKIYPLNIDNIRIITNFLRAIRHILEISSEEKNEIGFSFLNETLGFEVIASLIKEYIKYPLNKEFN